MFSGNCIWIIARLESESEKTPLKFSVRDSPYCTVKLFVGPTVSDTVENENGLILKHIRKNVRKMIFCIFKAINNKLYFYIENTLDYVNIFMG